MRAAYTPALNGAAKGTFHVVLFALLSLTACAGGTGETRGPLAPPPPAFTPVLGVGDDSLTITLKDVRPLQYADPMTKFRTEGGAAQECEIRHRFDRSSALAYNFSNHKSQLALKLDLDKTDVKGTMLRFTHKFQPLKNKREHCLYPSRVQGLLGSVYNEMFRRENDTVWQRLRMK